jgi:hypothetical protein
MVKACPTGFFISIHSGSASAVHRQTKYPNAWNSDDQKLALAAYGTPLLTKVGLAELGIDEPLDDGPVLPRDERIEQVLAQATR